MKRKLLAARPALKIIRGRAAERRITEAMQAMAEAATARLKALYPVVQSDSEVVCRSGSEAIGHLPEAGKQNLHGKGVVSQGNAGGHDPNLNQKGKLCLDRVWGSHADSFACSLPVNGTAASVPLKHIVEDVLGVAWLFYMLGVTLWVTGVQ